MARHRALLGPALGMTLLLLGWIHWLAPPLVFPGESYVVQLGAWTVSRPAAYYMAWAIGLYVGGITGLLVLARREALCVVSYSGLLLGAIAFVVGAKWQSRLETLPLAEALAVDPRKLLDPGLRLPLGILLGGLVACSWAAAWGRSWLATGDAYAAATSAAIPLGRVGCLLNGCCLGTVCARWARPICPTYPPRSEVYADQLAAHLIPLSAPVSLPAHPLPLYFAAASLVTLIVLVLLLRREARPGSVLAAFCVMWPAAKLALEPLRGVPRPSVLMVGIPASVLITTVVVLACGCVHRLLARRSIGARGSRAEWSGV